MKKSVGLVVVVKVPMDGQEVLMAVLQRRGWWNTEKMAPESYPGCCQVTCHGKVEDHDQGGEYDEFYNALIRESREELGATFTIECQSGVPLCELVHTVTTEKEVVTYGALVPIERLKMIRLGPDSGGLDLITQEQAEDLTEITPEMKKIGLEYSHTRAMFPDEIEAVKKAFKAFG